ncbi:MAG: hypothetical protein ACXVCP_08420 [Bdellovibrio sp.]
MKPKLLIPLFAMTLLSGCQGGQNNNEDKKIKTTETPPLQADDFKPKQITYDKKTGITITTEEMTEAAAEKLRKEAQLTSISSFPISSKYGTELYELSAPEYKDRIFVAPKIYAYSTNDGARMTVLDNNDGTVTIPFQVAMISGFEPKIADPSGRGLTETLPETYLVKDQENLKKELNSRNKTDISVLSGCVKQLTLSLPGKDLDVTAKDVLAGDFCEISKPFTVSIKVPSPLARYILQNALYDHVVDLRATYQTYVPYMVSRVDVDFDKEKIFDELEEHFSGNYKGIISVDARNYVEKIMKEQTMSVNIVGSYTTQLQAAVEQAMTLFFTPVPEDKKVELKCSPAAACLTINRDYRSNSQKLSFVYQQVSTTLAPKTFTTTTRLQPVNDRLIEIGDASQSQSQQSLQKPALLNNGSSIETGLTVQNGDILEIEPTFLVLEQRALDNEKVTRQDNNVCLTLDISIRCNYGGDFPICTPYVRGCLKSENQFVETIEYSSDTSKFVKVDKPTAKFEEIYNGLILKFTFNQIENGKSVFKNIDCPLKIYQREGFGQKISVRIENQPGCEIFGHENQNNPMLHLKNGINFPVTYKKGRDVKNWKNEITESHTTDTYYPSVEFGGTLTIRGYKIGNQLIN